MKKNKELMSKRMRFIAFGIFALIGILAFATDFMVATGVTTAMALVIGNITLEGDNETMYKALEATIKSTIEDVKKGLITEAKAGEIVTEKLKSFDIDLTDNEQVKALNTKLEAQGLVIKGLTEGGAKNKNLSTAQQMRKQIEANKAEWDAFKSGKNQNFEFEITPKNAGTMYISTNTGTHAWSGNPELEAGLTDVMRLQPMIIPLLNYAPTSSATITYVQKVNLEGAATLVNDTTIAPLVDFEIAVVNSSAVDYTDAIKVHQNMIDDIDFMAAEIDKELRYQVDLVADNAVVAALIAASPAFTLTSLAVLKPNIFDCIMAAATQIVSAFGIPTLAILNPVDFANMVMSKDSDGGYVMPPFNTANGTTVAGLRVIQSAQIAAGNIWVGDPSKFRVRELKSFTAVAGWEGSDISYRLITLVGVRRLHKYFKSNEAGAFVYDQIADIKNAIVEV